MRFQWEHKDFWRLEWRFEEAGQELLRFKSKAGSLKMKVRVDLAPRQLLSQEVSAAALDEQLRQSRVAPVGPVSDGGLIMVLLV
jgi:hypothetical protein